jgi:hypothetical protein
VWGCMIKSEKLKKLELELQDLQQWQKLGLVPKKDVEKHQNEIAYLQAKIEEEKERIRHVKESGEVEEYTAPKRSSQTKQVYQDNDSIPEIEEDENESFSFSSDSDELDASSLFGYEDTNEEGSEEEEDDEDPFSDKSRWKRGILEDPEADNW